MLGIATVKGLCGGSFLISDDLDSVNPRRLRIAQVLLPVTGKSAVPLDLLEKEIPEVGTGGNNICPTDGKTVTAKSPRKCYAY